MIEVLTYDGEVIMSKTLIIVESPNKCKTIQKYLGAEYEIVASVGHIVDLAKGGKFGIGVDLNNNLKPWYVLQTDKLAVFDKILEAASRCDNILLAGDPDREGCAINKHIYDRLLALGKPIAVISFNEITKAALEEAIKHPGEIDMNLFHAQQARRILDRIVGFMVSPFLMSMYEQNLSAGRVQSVAIRMIVDRDDEIQKFIPKEYWTLLADLISDQSGDKVKVKYDGKISNSKEVEQILSDCKGQSFVVSSVVRKSKKEKPQPPLTTLIMQQIMSKKFGFSADQTMKAAQSLYESGYSTYIRTDSVRIGDEAIQSIRKWISTQGFDLPDVPHAYEAKATSADSHEAIRCTNVNNHPDSSMLTGDEKTLYDVIWRYTVSCQMLPAVFDTLEVVINCGKHAFRISGKALAEKGFLEILGGDKDTKIDIPNFKVAETLTIKKLLPEQKYTQPPARYTEANLIKEMDAKQIGRPSTMATILKSIIIKNYVIKNGNTYNPTPLGVQITRTLEKYFGFVDFNYSAMMEKKLDQVADGSENYDKVMSDFYSLFSTEMRKACLDNKRVSCEKCNGVMSQRENAKGKYLSCSGCRNFKSLPTPIDVQEITNS